LHFPDPLWVEVIFDFACAFKRQPVERGNLLSALAPLYLGRVASAVHEMERLSAPEVEAAIERLCVRFESAKPRLLAQWDDSQHEVQPVACHAVLAEEVECHD
jgi:hypothetical protein